MAAIKDAYKRRGLTLGEFLEQVKAVAQYDNLDGVIYTFENIIEEEPSQAKRKV